ncbi:hypothetical protein AWZ03_006586 [Drosophila navojoa]|uniref:Uncharacterized protein n=1 Tax=Drosophila navojoa TaxID=7232 RepID=A0A484BGS7_DRONA|nr:hypothetical protein AWZ03_006586 [Drosophila navojoa]
MVRKLAREAFPFALRPEYVACQLTNHCTSYANTIHLQLDDNTQLTPRRQWQLQLQLGLELELELELLSKH